MFSTGEPKLERWTDLTEKSHVQQVIKASQNRAQLVYKHSHTCSVCFAAQKRLEASYNEIRRRADMHFVNVIKARPVSDELAERLAIRHESPQVLIVADGKCTWHASHWSIKSEPVLEALDGLETSSR